MDKWQTMIVFAAAYIYFLYCQEIWRITSYYDNRFRTVQKFLKDKYPDHDKEFLVSQDPRNLTSKMVLIKIANFIPLIIFIWLLK